MSTKPRRVDGPRATPAARYLAGAIGFALLAIVAVAVRELWLRNSSSTTWGSWVEPVMNTIGEATYQPWMLPCGIMISVIGIIIIWLSLRPRTRTHHQVQSTASMWMRPVDIARLLTFTARSVPGVSSAHSRVNSTTATISYTCRDNQPDLHEDVKKAAKMRLSELGFTVSLRVQQHEKNEGRR